MNDIQELEELEKQFNTIFLPNVKSEKAKEIVERVHMAMNNIRLYLRENTSKLKEVENEKMQGL